MATRSSVPAAGRPPFSHLSRDAQAAAKADDDDLDDEALDDEEGDDDDEEGDDEERGEKGKKTKKSKKTKKAEDDSDDDDEKKPDARAIRRRERARIHTILNCTAGKRLPDAAKHLALRTSTPRWSAVRLLRNMSANVPQTRGANLRDRMSGEVMPDIGAGDAQSAAPGSAKATADAIIAAGKKARGEI